MKGYAARKRRGKRKEKERKENSDRIRRKHHRGERYSIGEERDMMEGNIRRGKECVR
jgi:hypothetical protein